jgi:hypothetical protein
MYSSPSASPAPVLLQSSTAGLSCSYVPSWASYRVGFWISREGAYSF